MNLLRMNGDVMADLKNAPTAMDLQGKLELYFVGLVFTILGLSIQTSKLGGAILLPQVCEIGAWFLLLICGLVALWRMEHVPAYLKNIDDIEELRDQRNAFGDFIAKGVLVVTSEEGIQTTPHAAFSSTDATIEARRVIIKRTEDHQAIRYAAIKITFVLALFLLITSRSSPFALEVLKRYGLTFF